MKLAKKLCPAHVMPITNNINHKHKSNKQHSLFMFVLKFENLLLFFNVCVDLYTIISHNIIQILSEPAIQTISSKKLYS